MKQIINTILAVIVVATITAILSTSGDAQVNRGASGGGPGVGGASNLTTVGAVPFVSPAGSLNQDGSNFFWDSTNHRLGIGLSTPLVKLHVRTGTDHNFRVQDGTNLTVAAYNNANSGFVPIDFYSSAYTFNVGSFTLAGVPRFNYVNTTGSGLAALGANSPAITNTAPYTWLTILTADGSTGYIPVWK